MNYGWNTFSSVNKLLLLEALSLHVSTYSQKFRLLNPYNLNTILWLEVKTDC